MTAVHEPYSNSYKHCCLCFGSGGTLGNLNYKGLPAGSASDNVPVWTQVEFGFRFIIRTSMICQSDFCLLLATNHLSLLLIMFCITDNTFVNGKSWNNCWIKITILVWVKKQNKHVQTTRWSLSQFWPRRSVVCRCHLCVIRVQQVPPN